MRSLIFTIILIITSLISAKAELTNGAIYANVSTECHLIHPNGSVTTNVFASGRTITIGDALVEIVAESATLFYFSGGPLIEASAKSVISINLFDVDVENLNSTPQSAKFGNCNLSLKFDIGEFSVIYSNTNANSMLSITTPYTNYELKAGKYFFRITDKSAIVYVVEGVMNVHGDKRVDKIGQGKFAKVATTVKTLKQDESDMSPLSVNFPDTRKDDVRFFVIDSKVVGIWLK